MKRLILTLFVGLLCFTYQAKAQWTVIDPSNLVQNIKSAVQSSTTATNMVKSLQESIKIYNQSKAYYDALKSVHNIIKDARKVKLTLEMVSEITEIYTSGFNRMVSDPNFTVDELAAISAGYAPAAGGGRRAGDGTQDGHNRRQRPLALGQGADGRGGSGLHEDAGVPQPHALLHAQDHLRVLHPQPRKGRRAPGAGTLREPERQILVT